MLLAGAAFPVSAYGQCVTDRFTVDACMGGVRLTAPPGVTFDQSFLGGSLGPGAVFTRASTGTYYDSAGVLRVAGMNLWLQSADASNAAWLKTGIPKTIVANATVSPDGTTTAASVAYPLVSGAGALSVLAQSFTATVAPYGFSVYLKGAVGGERIYIMATADAVNYYRTQCILTTAWQRFVVTTPALTGASWFFQIGTDLRDASQTATPAQTVYVWGAQVEQNTFASPYAPTTTVANSGPRFDYDPATLQLKGLLLEDTSTNVALQSADLSNVAWTKGNLTVAAPVVTGNNIAAPDGTTTASRVVYPAVPPGANVSSVTQAVTVTATVYSFSMWLKGSVGGEVIYLYTTPDSTTYYRQQCILTTQWQRFTLTAGTLTATSWFFGVGNDGRGGGPSTLAQTIYAWGAQVEALPYASSYIPTTTVAVTRARDALSYPIASVTGFSATQGSLAHEYYVEGCVPNFTAPIQLVGASVNNDFISVDQLTTAGATGSTPVVSGVLIKAAAVTQGSANFTGGIATPGGVVHRGAAAWALSGTVICAHDGAGQSTITGTNTSLPVIANLTIAGQMNAQGNVVSQWARRTRYWPRQLTQAELISVTT